MSNTEAKSFSSDRSASSEAVPFSDDQIRQYVAYEKVRARNRWNMFDPKARKATGLTGEQYSFVMHNFSALRAQHETTRDAS
jgi:hypothetical protein